GSCRDDDVDYSILGLHLLETHGFAFTTEQVGDLWLLRLPYLQTFTAERAAYRNLANGLKPPLTATYDNPYQEWIGALIRADIHGWTSPGAPRRAPALARRDAVLSHTGNGVYGAMWAAALIAAAFTAETVREAVEASLAVIPASSRLARTVRRVASLHETGLAWEDTLATLDKETAGLGWIHTVPNAAVLTTACSTATATSPAPSPSPSAAAWTPTPTARRRARWPASCAYRQPYPNSGARRWRKRSAARSSGTTPSASPNWQNAPHGWPARRRKR